MSALSVSPNPAAPNETVGVSGSGFDPKRKVQLALAGTGWTTNYFRPRRDGSFAVGMNVPDRVGSFSVVARDASSSTTVASTSVTVTVPTPVPAPAPEPVPPPAFPWSSLQQAIAATAAGGTLDATGRTFTETVTIEKPLTVKGGTIDGQDTRQQWVRVWAPDVTLQDMAFLRAAKGAVQTGSIDVAGARVRLIRPKAVSGSYAVLRLWTGSDNAYVEAPDFSGAAMGVVGWESHGATIKGGTIHDCIGTGNTGWEAGGFKFGQSRNALVQGVEIFHIEGPGGWLDVFCSGGQLLDNHVHDNTRCGLMVEITDGWVVAGNVVHRNGLNSPGNAFEMNGGIFLSSSKNGRCTGNTVAWNGPGTTQPAAADITIVSQNRELQPHSGVVVTGNVLRRAPVFYTDVSGAPNPVISPNTIVPDTDSRIAALR